MDHIKAASRSALREGASPRMEPGRQLISRFTKLVASTVEPDPPQNPQGNPLRLPQTPNNPRVREAIVTSRAKATSGPASVSEPTPVTKRASGVFGSKWFALEHLLTFEYLLPTVIVLLVLTTLTELFIQKRARDRRRPGGFEPIDLPAYSRDDRNASFVAASEETHADLSRPWNP